MHYEIKVKMINVLHNLKLKNNIFNRQRRTCIDINAKREVEDQEHKFTNTVFEVHGISRAFYFRTLCAYTGIDYIINKDNIKSAYNKINLFFQRV